MSRASATVATDRELRAFDRFLYDAIDMLVYETLGTDVWMALWRATR